MPGDLRHPFFRLLNKLMVLMKSAHKKPTVVNTFRRDYQLWIMIFPAIVVIFIFNYIPMYGIQLAFRDYDFSKGLTGAHGEGCFISGSFSTAICLRT